MNSDRLRRIINGFAVSAQHIKTLNNRENVNMTNSTRSHNIGYSYDVDSSIPPIKFLYEERYADFTPNHSFFIGTVNVKCPVEEIENFLSKKMIDGFEYFNSYSGYTSAELRDSFPASEDPKKSFKKVIDRVTSKTFVGLSKDNGFQVEMWRKESGLLQLRLSGYSQNYGERHSLVEEFINFLSNYVARDDKTVSIICSGNNGFYLEEIEMTKKVDFSYDNYNKDFRDVSEMIIEQVHERNTGLVLLHGVPGTGKTSYIRYLINTLNKNVIYMPPDISVELSSPRFIPFLMENKNSVLVIEDAENILATREAGGNQAVSNILNASDGILGDAISNIIICTFNTERDKVDSALLRKGRLIAEYKFDYLGDAETDHLYRKLHDGNVPPRQNMTLAEIYNENSAYHATKEKEKVFGFTS